MPADVTQQKLPTVPCSLGDKQENPNLNFVRVMFDSCEPFSTNGTDHQSESEIGMKKPRFVCCGLEPGFEFAASLSIQNLRSLVERAEVERTSLL